MSSARCYVCLAPLRGKTYFLCSPCGRSYDRALEKDVSVAGIIEWASSRARKYAGVDWSILKGVRKDGRRSPRWNLRKGDDK